MARDVCQYDRIYSFFLFNVLLCTDPYVFTFLWSDVEFPIIWITWIWCLCCVCMCFDFTVSYFHVVAGGTWILIFMLCVHVIWLQHVILPCGSWSEVLVCLCVGACYVVVFYNICTLCSLMLNWLCNLPESPLASSLGLPTVLPCVICN